MSKTKSLTVEKAINYDSGFTDYTRFDSDPASRAEQRRAFLDASTWAPAYIYPKLNTLSDVRAGDSDNQEDAYLLDQKGNIHEAIMVLEAARLDGDMDGDELDVYADFHELRLKRIMLVEEARNMLYADSSSAVEVARQEFMSLNREVYGEFDNKIYLGMLHSEQQRVNDFQPRNKTAEKVKKELSQFFEGKQLDEGESIIVSPELMEKMGNYVQSRYGHILEVVPGTDDDVLYDAIQCRDIMTSAMDRGGFVEQGWKVAVSKKISIPFTSTEDKTIYLPADLARTSAELKRLIIHEQEVHARRGQNGIESGLIFLEKGTADYADVEEGFGVLLEAILSGESESPAFHRARDRYITAGLALGADGTPRDARQTFEILWRLLAARYGSDGMVDNVILQKAQTDAYRHIENAFRGTNFAMRGVIFTKLKVYYEGLKKNADYFEGRIDDLDAAFADATMGKLNHTDENEVAKIRKIEDRKRAA